MIFDALIGIALRGVAYLIAFLPIADGNITSFITTASTTVDDMLNGINFMIDIRTFKMLMFYELIIFIVLIETKIFQWVLKNLTVGMFKDL